MLKFLLFMVLIPFFMVFSQENEKLNVNNPFFIKWDTPFETPPFDLIKTEHFMPALLEGMKQQKVEVNAIINSKEEPTFENTLEALEISGALLTKVNSVFSHLYSTMNSAEMQKISQESSPLLSAHNDDINLNEKLFVRVKTIYNKMDKLNSEQKRLVDKYYKGFIRGGAALNDADKEKFRKLNEELSMLTLKFSQNVLAETNAFELVVDDVKELSGLPESALNAALEAAKKKGYENKYLFTLHAPSYRPIIQYADSRSLREKMFKTNMNRANNNNENDNKEIISKIVSLRYQRAKLLGYKSHADYVMSEYMAKTPERVYDFLNTLREPATKLALNEAAQLQEIVKREGKDFRIEPWDWSYYSEKLKKEKYDLSDEELRPYFKMENVLEGVFAVTKKLYGIQFVDRKDIVAYHPDVRVFEVKEENGKHIGIIYFDYFPRESKRAGAWMMPFRVQQRVGGQNVTPIVMNSGNLNKPTETKPSLLTLDEVKTIFHEFGHALHGLFSDVTFPTLSATSVEWDFVELPSKIMENWASHPEALRMFAKHYETGEVMPDILIEKIQKAKLFNKGFETLGGYVIPSLLDLKYHDMREDKKVDVAEVEAEVKQGLMPEIGLRYASTINSHIFAGGYSAGYYSYIWSELIEADAFDAFIAAGVFDRETAASFRKNILSKGGSDDALELYKNFRGKEPSAEPLMKRRGLLKN